MYFSVRVVFSAETDTNSMFTGAKDEAVVTDENRVLMSDLGIEDAQGLGTIYSGEEVSHKYYYCQF